MANSPDAIVAKLSRQAERMRLALEVCKHAENRLTATQIATAMSIGVKRGQCATDGWVATETVKITINSTTRTQNITTTISMTTFRL